jgi:hypothetical protein
MEMILMDVRALIVLVLAGCSVGAVNGDDTGPDANNQNADLTFNQQVKPLVTRCLGCHGTTQAPNLTSATALQAKYKMKPGATNILVTKGSMGSPPGTHEGITYLDATAQSAVAMWIDSL